MLCHRQGLKNRNTNTNTNTKTKTNKHDKYKNNRQTYVVICFWKGDDKMSLIMQNMKNMQNMQNRPAQLAELPRSVFDPELFPHSAYVT